MKYTDMQNGERLTLQPLRSKCILRTIKFYLLILLIMITAGCDLFFEGTNIIYHGNGHESGDVPKDRHLYSDGEVCILRGNDHDLARAGYIFTGWKTDPYSNHRSYKPGYEYYIGEKYPQLQFYAHWETISYPVRYELRGGEQHEANPNQYTRETSLRLSPPRKDGADFVGWYLDQNCTEEITEIRDIAVGPLTLYALWNNREYALRYHLDGGQNDPRNPTLITPDDEISRLYDPAHAQKQFHGWYLDSSLKTRITSIPAGTHTHVDLYASWEPRQTRILYHANNGSDDTDTTVLNWYSDASVKENEFAASAGYDFLHWTTDADGVGDVFTPGDSIALEEDTLHIYAQWSPKTYEITYEHTMGYAVPNPSSYTVEDELIELSPLTAEGYDSKGWYLEYDQYSEEYSLPVTTIYPRSMSDFVLYACMEPRSYRIYTHYEDPHETVKNWLCTYGSNCSISPDAVERPGYDLAGWALTPGGEIVHEQDISMTFPNRNVHLYGVWYPHFETSSTGPSGGTVIYDKGEYSDGWRYIEMAPNDIMWEDKPWGGYGYELPYMSQDHGKGKEITEIIIEAFGYREPYENRKDYAAKLCDDLVITRTGTVYDDWFLPSLETSSLIHNSYISGKIWSANPRDKEKAFTIRNNFGMIIETPSRSALRNVRPVRRF
ncbi:MAG: InlB B-repeat-containing protein [Spirochaetia bacterium]|nr:InlB B-repeat-containing protein [Spirochaetia bacterium]